MLHEEVLEHYELWCELNQVYADWCRAHGVSIHRLTVLEALWFQQKTGCTLRSLQDRLYLPKQTIHTIVDGLVKEGYLERLPSPEDKRTKVLRLTESGLAYAKTQVAPMYQWEGKAMRQLAPDDRAVMLRTYKQLIDALRTGFEEEDSV